MGNFEITERWLMEAGGWQVMKRARNLVDQGKVLDVTFDGTLVRGTLADGKRGQRSGMLIRGRTDVENLCQCVEARRSGILCQHALALGLAVAREGAAGPEKGAQARRRRGWDGGEGRGGGRAVETSKGGTSKGETDEGAFRPPASALRMRFAVRAAEGFGRGTLGVQVEETGTEEGMEADLPLLAWLQRHGQKTVPPQLMLQREHLGTFLGAVQGHPRIFWGEETLRVESMPLRLMLTVEARGTDRVTLQPAVPEGVSLAVTSEGVWGWLKDRRALLRLPSLQALASGDREELLGALGSDRKAVERSWRWFFRHAETLENAFRLDTRGLSTLPKLVPAQPRFHLALEGSLNHLSGRLTVRYDHLQVLVGVGSEAFPYAREGVPGIFYQRHLGAEEQAVHRLQAAGFTESDGEGTVVLKGERATLKFFAGLLPALERDVAWEVEIGQRFAHVTRDIERITPVVRAVPHPDGGWLDIDIGYSAAGKGGEGLPRQEVQRLLRVGQSDMRLKNGRRVVIDLEACEELDAVLRDIEPDQEHGRFRIPASQEEYLRETLEETAWRGTPGSEPAPYPEESLGDLGSILRDYQREGVCWMLGRTERGLSGILADEMGLGKTLQSLAVIQALRAAAGSDEGIRCSLVVCPTSLLDNWCAEAARFTPELTTLKIHGPQRSRMWRKVDRADVVVTSYGMLVRDQDRFRQHRWLSVFLDEASAIKNASTKNARAASGIDARFRFALTGTPIENSVRDIWSIMHFVAPGYLGSQATFRERYELALSKESGPSSGVQERLRRRLRPFILRRTKRAVASELPDRIEKVLTCSLSAAQRDTYTDLLRAGREKVLEARDRGEGAARMTMLTTLLRLRQVCCDLRLLGGEPDLPPGKASGKLAAIRELLQEAEEGQHRVLIFSQFVGMLQLLKADLELRGTAYCYLDGQTQGRQAEVDRFQQGEIPVFLISLKAGGYGLNLTAADTVIHFDPWWNPAVEAQATDRAHRIGQQNVVTSYKLISEDTVEEKILRLQRRKRQVIDAALDDDQPLMQGLTQGDLEEVLDI